MKKLVHGLLPCALFACGPGPMVDSATQERAAYPLSTAIWPGGMIEVCWEQADQVGSAEAEIVQDAVEYTWEIESSVNFVGWENTCTSNSRGIRIKVANETAHTVGLGTEIDGVPNGMVLNYNSSVYPSIEFMAVHEFGHALGFSHEQNRSDTPSSCTQSPQGTNGNFTIGAWDINSIMNYCNPNQHVRAELSDTDKLAVKALYGPWKEVTIKSHEDYYLRAVNGGNSDVYADRSFARWHEVFMEIPLEPQSSNNKFAYRTMNGHYLKARHGGGSGVDARSSWIRKWETFKKYTNGSGWALRADNDDYVRAANGGGGGVYADRSFPDIHEKFTIQQTPFQYRMQNRIALKTHNGHYIKARNGGGAQVEAHETHIGYDEVFDLIFINQSQGKAVLRSQTGHLMIALNGGGGGVNADLWVANAGGCPNCIFTVENKGFTDDGNDIVALKTRTGHYVRAANGGGGDVRADRTSANDHEKFVLIQ